MIRRTLISILLASMFIGQAGQAGGHAAGRAAQDRAVIRLAQSKVSLDQAVAKVLRTFGGQLLKAETRGNVHYVKVVMDNGRVRTVRVDANSGRIL